MPPVTQGFHINEFRWYDKRLTNGVDTMSWVRGRVGKAMGHTIEQYVPYDPELPPQEGVTQLPAIRVSKDIPPVFLPLAWMPAIYKALQAEACDVVVLHQPISARIARLTGEWANAPLIAYAHTQYEQYFEMRVRQQFLKMGWRGGGLTHKVTWPTVRKLLAKAYNQCDLVVAVAEGMRDTLISYGVDPERIVVIPNDVDFDLIQQATPDGVREEFGIPQEAKLIISVGRILEEKNVMGLVRSVESILRETETYLILVGKGEQRAEIEEWATGKGIREKIIFTGGIDPGRIPSLLKASDLYLTAALTEVRSMSWEEALASALPIVALDCYNAREALIDGVTGLVVPRNSDDPIATSSAEELALGNAVRKILRDDAFRARLSAGAHEQSRKRAYAGADLFYAQVERLVREKKGRMK